MLCGRHPRVVAAEDGQVLRVVFDGFLEIFVIECLAPTTAVGGVDASDGAGRPPVESPRPVARVAVRKQQ